ncbi:MAG: permease-like cell division protein FtsX [Rhodocyclaceae bacterium]
MSLHAHRFAFVRAARRLTGRPLTALLSGLVIAIALALPALGYTLIDNLASLARGVSGKPEISVFLRTDADERAVAMLRSKMQSDTRIAAVRFVPKDQALKQLAQRGGFADIAQTLPENPLPDAFVLEPASDAPEDFNALASMLSGLPQVARVQLDSAWIERMHALIELGRSAVLLLAGLLGAALVIVTFNTIRLQILTQRAEISVSMLLGATREFVRRPFLYFGFLQGLLGGLLAWGLVVALMLLIGPRVQAFAQTYSIVLDMPLPAWREVAALLVFAAVLGWLGAALSVHRHLHDGLISD